MVKNFVTRNLKKFRDNREGIAYVYAVAGITIIFIPFIYWILSSTLDQVAIAIFAQYTFTGNILSAWTLAKAIISAVPAIIMFTTVFWAIINSKARSYEQ